MAGCILQIPFTWLNHTVFAMEKIFFTLGEIPHNTSEHKQKRQNVLCSDSSQYIYQSQPTYLPTPTSANFNSTCFVIGLVEELTIHERKREEVSVVARQDIWRAKQELEHTKYQTSPSIPFLRSPFFLLPDSRVRRLTFHKKPQAIAHRITERYWLTGVEDEYTTATSIACQYNMEGRESEEWR